MNDFVFITASNLASTAGDPDIKKDIMATPKQVQKAIEDALKTIWAAAVSVKLLPFWPEKSTLWFAQAEAQFTIKSTTV